MEVKRIFGRTLLLAAVFGAASITMADEDSGFISTDSSATAAAIEAVDTDIPTAAPADSAKTGTIANIVKHDTTSAWDIIEFSGFVNGGGIMNTHGATYNMVGCNSDRDIQLNTAYLRAFKKAQTGHGVFDWGFGTDALWGSEGHLFRGYTGLDSDWATGHRSSDYNGVADLSDRERENYAGAMPQLYGELSAYNWKFKAGRFYSLMGYEGPGDSRFFYTYGRTFEMTPVTHTGAIATFCGIQNMEWSLGWVMGENNMFSRGYDESLITGGVKLYNGDWVSLKYAFVAGDGAMGGTGGDLFRNDVVLTANLGNCWGAAFLFNCGKFDGEGGGSWGTSATLNDLAQYYGNIKYQSWGTYLYYTLSPNWKLGTRMEWQRGVDTDETDGMEILEISAGVNWMPTACDNFAIRPEIRYDKAHMADASGYDGMFGNGLAHDDQFTLACDMIYKF
ncbi:MAG: outer membrane beta-barrel protein [Thermoguttaceae bacterium]|nr:outer membrane beta-barrel protein [Thermoguttaceae bacterium]